MGEIPDLADRSAIRTRLEVDRDVHFYGLGDLGDAYWNRSRWWIRDGATIGEVGLSDDPAHRVVYGINTGAPTAALELWADLDPLLPDRYFATGVTGFAQHLAERGREIETDYGQHTKMILADEAQVWPRAASGAAAGCRPLSRPDLAAIAELHSIHDDASTFFAPELLDAGPFYGCFSGRSLVAMAGIHLCDLDLGVAAVGGVLTREDHRGKGLASATTASVVAALLDKGVATIGLNVMTSNVRAVSIYERLGFTPVHTYQEALLRRRST